MYNNNIFIVNTVVLILKLNMIIALLVFAFRSPLMVI